MQPNPTCDNVAATACGTVSAAPADLLSASVAEALEVMAFVIAEPVAPADAAVAPDGDLLLTRVPIDGASGGTLEVACPASFGGVLEANVGLENAPSDGIGAAGLRELGNVVCGLLIRRLRDAGGGDAMIGLPDQAPIAAAAWPAFAAAAGGVVMDADGTRIAVRVRPAKCGGGDCRTAGGPCGRGGREAA